MMKNIRCIVIADSAELELWEWLVFSRIISSCDIRQIQVLNGRRKKIPLFYASHMVGLNAKLAKNSQLTVVECDGPVASDDIDYIFCFNRRSCEYLNSNVPVMFIERSGDPRYIAGLKEYVKGEYAFYVSIRVLSCGKEYLLKDATLKNDRVSFSTIRNLLRQVMPDMVQECIVLMQHDAWRKQDVQNERPWKSHDTQKFYKLDWIHCHVIAAFRLVKKFFNYLCYWEKWHIGIVNDDIRTILSDMKINNVRWLPEIQKHQFVADPFAVHHEGNVYIFAEFWDATSPVGRIVFTDETRGYGKWEEVFNSTTHLSYPYLLMDGDTYYCMPESSESGDLVLYKSTEFPRVWAKEKMIFESSNIVDASIVLYNDTYWLFAARDRGDSSFELDVWFADCLAGKWFPHPQNPVKRDITSARPAGTPFIVDNVLYRPGQECSLSYGSGIAINRITLLSGTEYAEERVGIICGPDNSPYPDGMHTLSVVGGMVVIDAKKKVFTLFNHRVIAYKSKRIIRSLHKRKMVF